MIRLFSVVLQFLLFLTIFLAGSLLSPFHLRWFITHPTLTSTRYFTPDGLILSFACYMLIVLVLALMKRLSTAAPWTTLAFVLALAVGLFAKFGFATHDLF
jgi:peptidoglycan/LPS O-acetylase OafA/YrhL